MTPSTECPELESYRPLEIGQQYRADRPDFIHIVATPPDLGHAPHFRALRDTLSPDPIDLEIERARDILAWPDDWDGDGSRAYDEAVFERTANFLRALQRDLRRRGALLPTPRVSAGPDGSFDVQWILDSRAVLVNIPPHEAPTYALQAEEGRYARGALSLTDDNSGLFAWLLKL